MAVRERYANIGYAGPFRAEWSESDAVVVRALARPGSPPLDFLNRHLDIAAVARICRLSAIVRAVQDVLGPDVLLWRTAIFAVTAKHQNLPWHRDAYDRVIGPTPTPTHCSVQLNLTDSTQSNTVALVPGSHRWTDGELERRGFSMVADESPESEGVPVFMRKPDVPVVAVPMKSGEFYVFHPRVLHASMVRPGVGENAVRCSIALRVATTATKILPEAFSRTPSRSGCVLLAGVDQPGVNKLATWPT